jgi:hypothetical protein
MGPAHRETNRRRTRQQTAITESRDVSGFNEIVLQGSGEVVVTVDGTEALYSWGADAGGRHASLQQQPRAH